MVHDHWDQASLRTWQLLQRGKKTQKHAESQRLGDKETQMYRDTCTTKMPGTRIEGIANRETLSMSVNLYMFIVRQFVRSSCSVSHLFARERDECECKKDMNIRASGVLVNVWCFIPLPVTSTCLLSVFCLVREDGKMLAEGTVEGNV